MHSANVLSRFFLKFTTGVAAAALGIACWATVSSTSLAQEEAGQTQPPAASPEEGAPAPDEKPQEGAAPDAAALEDGATVYAAKLQQWRDILKDLRDLKARFQTASPEEGEKIRARWDELIAKGNALLPELQSAALETYKAAPNLDRQLTRLLYSFADDAAKQDRYETARELAEALIANGSGVTQAYDVAGVAAFALNDYDKAKDYLQEAAAAGVISEKGREFLATADDYKRYWQEEQELRKKEAEADDLPRVKITTNKGEIVVELFENEAPGAVGNFISLVERGFYDGLVFHRVLPQFMAQGGDPSGDGTGGPGYNIYCEVNKPGYRRHFQGSLSMAHAGPNTGGSQFFLTFLPTPSLNGKHTVFGRVVEGMDVLPKLQRIDPGESVKPEPDKIVKAEVIRKRPGVEYVPNKVK